MKNPAYYFLSLLLMVNVIFSYDKNKTANLIPKPNTFTLNEGTYSLSKKTSIIDQGKKISGYFISRLKELTGLSLTISNKNNQNNSIFFKLENSFSPGNPEAYKMNITKNGIEISSSSETGLFRGIQTLFQLIPPAVKSSKSKSSIKLPCCQIIDQPAFSWRGLNLDCSRHFMDKDFVKRYIDILAYYKFNVLHWHLTDDQGWRIEIKKYPKLTQIGAWRKELDGSNYGGFYTQEDIKEIVKYAESRHITIVPEIEMPGHALASLASYPENSCTGGPFEVTNIWGVINDVYCAGKESTFNFLQDVLDEVTVLFPGKYIHIGGDEVPKDRWKACPDCLARIKTEGLKDEHELQSYFVKRISSFLNAKGKTVIGWEEILQGGLAQGAIVQSWQGFQGAIDAAKLGHYSICSPTSHTYFDYDQDKFDLKNTYSFFPVSDAMTKDEAKFVLGGEGNLWSEYAPMEKVDSKLFPRILALSEVLWSSPQNKNFDEFLQRVKNSYADLSALGINYGRETKVFNYSTSYDTSTNKYSAAIIPLQNDVQIHYTKNGSEPTINSPVYKNSIIINKSLTLKIASFRGNHYLGNTVSLPFVYHKALYSDINIVNKYSNSYKANGEFSLVDGICGTTDFKDGAWQGYEGIDFECIIDLKELKNISKISPRFILNSSSWVFLPNKVTISISEDNKIFSPEIIIANTVSQKTSDVIVKDFSAIYEKLPARYIKIKAESIKTCPAWHPGNGNKAWLFIDEVIVE